MRLQTFGGFSSSGIMTPHQRLIGSREDLSTFADEGEIFTRNIEIRFLNHAAACATRAESSATPLWNPQISLTTDSNNRQEAMSASNTLAGTEEPSEKRQSNFVRK